MSNNNYDCHPSAEVKICNGTSDRLQMAEKFIQSSLSNPALYNPAPSINQHNFQ